MSTPHPLCLLSHQSPSLLISPAPPRSSPPSLPSCGKASPKWTVPAHLGSQGVSPPAPPSRTPAPPLTKSPRLPFELQPSHLARGSPPPGSFPGQALAGHPSAPQPQMEDKHGAPGSAPTSQTAARPLRPLVLAARGRQWLSLPFPAWLAGSDRRGEGTCEGLSSLLVFTIVVVLTTQKQDAQDHRMAVKKCQKSAKLHLALPEWQAVWAETGGVQGAGAQGPGGQVSFQREEPAPLTLPPQTQSPQRRGHHTFRGNASILFKIRKIRKF